MAKSLSEILASLQNLCDKEISQLTKFGIEFGTYSQKVIDATNVKNIVVSPFVDLKLLHFMNENNANLAVTAFPKEILRHSKHW
ncbi:MAG: hypothetical protein ACXABK_02025 [Candidatus Heimdallarchaeaceae archaeon]|jgi:hypothetical protein